MATFADEVAAAHPTLFRYAMSLTSGQRERAEDLAQATILKGLEKQSQFTPGTSLISWLSTICLNEFRSNWRKHRREVEDVDGAAAGAVAVEGNQESSLDLKRLREIIAGLHPDWRASLEDIALGHSYEEAAERAGIAVGTIKSRVSRVRSLLTGAFDEAPEFDQAGVSDVRPLETASFTRLPPARELAGDPPMLAWLPVSSLRIDVGYQRSVLERGRTSVLKIYETFDWRKFGVLVAADAGDGTFLLIDGQHRATAATLRGIDRVPVLVVSANRAEQAASFAAINGARLAISHLHVHAAAIAAGDPAAIRVRDVCASAGVEIARYPLPRTKLRPHQTLALRAIELSLRTHGAGALKSALEALRKQRALSAPLIKALTFVIANQELTPETVEEKYRGVNFLEVQQAAEVEAREKRMSVHLVLEPKLRGYLQ